MACALLSSDMLVTAISGTAPSTAAVCSNQPSAPLELARVLISVSWFVYLLWWGVAWRSILRGLFTYALHLSLTHNESFLSKSVIRLCGWLWGPLKEVALAQSCNMFPCHQGQGKAGYFRDSVSVFQPKGLKGWPHSHEEYAPVESQWKKYFWLQKKKKKKKKILAQGFVIIYNPHTLDFYQTTLWHA